MENPALKTIYEDGAALGIITIPQNKWINMLKCGIINVDVILSQIMTEKERAVLAVHKYAISPLSDGRFGTYVPDNTKSNKRKNIKQSDYKAMIECLFKFYGLKESKKKIRLCDIFDEWLEYKSKKKQNSAATKKQNKASYNKYVKGTSIDLKDLNDITTMDLENWAIDILVGNDMTAKNFNTHKLVVTGPLKYAVRAGYIRENPWKKEEMEYTHLFCSERIRPSEESVFYPDEIKELCQEFERGYDYNGNIANLGLKANFDIGLRVGELAALKWSDINFANETVFIRRQENSSGKVEEYVKSDSEAGYRELELSDEFVAILKRIKRDRVIMSEYVFCNPDGSRVDKMQFIHRLTRAEDALGWSRYKYTHCIRRTVASRMNANGWPLEEIRRWLGHTTKETTLKYLYNPFRESETKNKVKNMSILHTNDSCLQLSSKAEGVLRQEKMLKAL